MTTAYDSSRLFLGNLRTGLTNGELVGFLVSKGMAPNFVKIVSRGAAAGSDFAFVGFKDEAAYQDIFTYTKHKCEICAPGRGLSISWNSDKRGKPTEQPLPPQSVPPRPRGLIFLGKAPTTPLVLSKFPAPKSNMATPAPGTMPKSAPDFRAPLIRCLEAHARQQELEATASSQAEEWLDSQYQVYSAAETSLDADVRLDDKRKDLIVALKKSLIVAKDELVVGRKETEGEGVAEPVQSDEIDGNAVAEPVHNEETDGNGQFM